MVNSRSTIRSAASTDSPRNRAARWRSARWLPNSTTTSPGRGSSLLRESCARTSAAQSRMTQSRRLGQGVYERRPSAPLRSQHAFALCGQPIASPSSLPRLFHPAAADPTPVFQSIEQRIERCHVKGQESIRPPRDFARDLVAVQLSVFEGGEDQQLGAALASGCLRNRVCNMWE